MPSESGSTSRSSTSCRGPEPGTRPPVPATRPYGVGFTIGFFWGASGGWYRPCCYGGGVYVSHHNNINIDNSYNRWGNRAQAGQLPANRPETRQVGNTTVAKGANNNVYAGRDGQVLSALTVTETLVVVLQV